MATTGRDSGAAAAPSPMLTVAAVARRLGVAPSTLRTWDRRYDLGPSAHTAGLPPPVRAQDLARLVVMRRLTLEGVPPAEAARIALAARSDAAAGPVHPARLRRPSSPRSRPRRRPGAAPEPAAGRQPPCARRTPGRKRPVDRADRRRRRRGRRRPARPGAAGALAPAGGPGPPGCPEPAGRPPASSRRPQPHGRAWTRPCGARTRPCARTSPRRGRSWPGRAPRRPPQRRRSRRRPARRLPGGARSCQGGHVPGQR